MITEEESDREGPCERCGSMKQTTFHHEFCRRHGWPNRLRDIGLELCHSCHQILNQKFLQLEEDNGGRLEQWMYPHVALDHITNGSTVHVE